MPPTRPSIPGLLAALVLAAAAHGADDSVHVRFPNGVEKRGVLVSASPLSLRIAETHWERMHEMLLTIRYDRVAELRINGVPVDLPVTLAGIERARRRLPDGPQADDPSASVPRPVEQDSCGMPPAPSEPLAPSVDSASGTRAPQAPERPAAEQGQSGPAAPPASTPAPEAPAGPTRHPPPPAGEPGQVE